MASLLLVAHAPLASALQAVARHVYPDCSRTLAGVDVDAGAEPAMVEAQIRAALAALAASEVLILVDVFGATPCNAAAAVADGVHARLVAGVNVPMLWRALCYAELPLQELVTRAVAGATQGVMQVPVPRQPGPPISTASHDQSQPQHHQ